MGPRLNPRLLFILTCSQQLDFPKKIFRVLITQATAKTKEVCCCLLVHNVAISVQEHKACPKADRAGYIIEFYIPIKPVLWVLPNISCGIWSILESINPSLFFLKSLWQFLEEEKIFFLCGDGSYQGIQIEMIFKDKKDETLRDAISLLLQWEISICEEVSQENRLLPRF